MVYKELSDFQLTHSSRAYARDRRRALRAAYPNSGTTVPELAVGVWDSASVLTPLELAVVVSLSTSIEERHVEVLDQGMHFYEVIVRGEGLWLLELMKSDGFVTLLNQQASLFGGRLVLSQEPVERDSGVAVGIPPTPTPTPTTTPTPPPSLPVYPPGQMRQPNYGRLRRPPASSTPRPPPPPIAS